MQIRHFVSALGLSVILAGCGAEAAEKGSAAEATTVATDIEKLLKGITSKETAESAKTELAALVEKLKGALPKMPTAEEGKGMLESGMESAKKAAGSLSGDLTKVLGNIGAEVKRIMGNTELAAPIKDALGKLSKLMPGK